MAVTADQVIVELKAETDRYFADLRRTQAEIKQWRAQFQREVWGAEQAAERSTTAIGNSFKRMAAVLTSAIGAREILRMADSYTRLQNSLRVVGLEGEALTRVQDALFEAANRNGTDVEALAQVYSRAALAGKELGASQQQLLTFVNAIADSLRVQGGSAAAASGALLQLSQAIGSSVVRAEEFNSIQEGALPIVQAAAKGIERFGGSVQQLRAAVLAGQVTSKEFFEGILRSAPDLAEKAAKSNLTLAGSFQSLQNQLTRYIGEADQGAGVTNVLGFAIRKLADNLHLIDGALAVIGGSLLGRFTQRQIEAAVALGRGTAAARSAAIATRALGAAWSFIGGLPGLIFTAVTALVLFNDTTTAAEKAAQENAAALADLDTAIQNVDRSNRDAVAGIKERIRADLDAARAALENAKAQQALFEAQDRLQFDPAFVTLSPEDQEKLAADSARRGRAVFAKELEERGRMIEALQGRLESLDAPPGSGGTGGAGLGDTAGRKGGERRDADAAVLDYWAHLNSLMAEGQRITESLWTVEEQRAATQARLKELLDAGAISQETYTAAFERTTEAFQRQQELAQAVQDSFERAFDRIGGAITEAFVTGELSAVNFGNIAKAVIAEVLQDMLRLAVINPLKNLAVNFLTSLVGAAFGGAPAAGPTYASLSARGYHSGGIVGEGGFTRSVPAAAFAGAPRLHSGGLAGGEVPAVLMRGEEVLTASDPRHRRNGGLAGGPPVQVNIINNAPNTETRQQRGQDGRSIDVIIDEISAGNMGRRGSASNRQLRQMGAAAPLASR